MSVLERLSSASGDSTEASNKAVAAEALDCPDLLDEVAAGLELADRKLLGDCVEVFTEVAKERPALVAPYAARIIPLLGHRDTRVRWEATHAVALVAALVPDQIAPLLPDLAAKIERDRSVIVRDCAVIALGEYGRSGPEAARRAFPLLGEGAEGVAGQTRQTGAGGHGQAAGRGTGARARGAGRGPNLPGSQAGQRPAAGATDGSNG